MAKFDRPIPGQSLTETPKNRPYERPPEITDPERALQVHLLRLSEPERMKATLDLLEEGVDLVSVVEAITRNAVMNGVHSVDVSLIISPVIHEFIKSTADEFGIEYEEGFENKKEKQRITYVRQESKAKRMLEKMGVETASPEAAPVENLEKTPEEKPTGLMARG